MRGGKRVSKSLFGLGLLFLTLNGSCLLVLESTASRRTSCVWTQGEHSSAQPCPASDKSKIKGSCIISSQHTCYVARANLPLARRDDDIFY